VPTLQAALDDWARWEPELRAVEPTGPFDPALCAAPLPRAYQWLDGSAYLNHVRLARAARGVEMPPELETVPLMYQGMSDGNLGPREPIRTGDDWGTDFEAEVAVILGDVPMGASREVAAGAIRLVTILNDVSLREIIPGELARGFGFVQGKPACAHAPVAVTPDALPGWDGGRLHGVMEVDLDGEPFGRPDAGRGMAFDFPTLVAHAARTRALSAGTVIGAGTVSSEGGALAEGGPGFACIAEARMVETIRDGAPRTPWLSAGQRVRIAMEPFGSIEQVVI
jgi:fumarylacetoacetate (FAA) hydrolase